MEDKVDANAGKQLRTAFESGSVQPGMQEKQCRGALRVEHA